uniref:SOUL heme-binding protein n=1 Tax=Alexandrium catenella TaxID=2925 RepID=A0A7S1QNH0_ALECA
MAVHLPAALTKSRPARWLVTAALGVATLGMLSRYVVMPLLFWRRAESCERPEYAVVGSLSGQTLHGSKVAVELRRYESYLVAEVRVPEGLSKEEQQQVGFGQVARYIFGDNLRRRSGPLGRYFTVSEPEAIAMTAPVRQELAPAVQMSMHEELSETALVSFTMPSKYQALYQLPVPKNSNVTLRVEPAHYSAAVGFRGPPPSAAKIAELRAAMNMAIENAGLEAEEERGMLVYQYHDPFATPNLLRWNELVIFLKPDGLKAIVPEPAQAVSAEKDES